MEKKLEGFSVGQLFVSGSLDCDRELYVEMDSVDALMTTYLSEAQVIQLRDHLNAIIAKEINL